MSSFQAVVINGLSKLKSLAPQSGRDLKAPELGFVVFRFIWLPLVGMFRTELMEEVMRMQEFRLGVFLINRPQRQLKEKGIKIETEADENTFGPASFTVNDPDGNPILVDQHV